MPRATILFADNDPNFLKTRSEFLERAGYLVIPAHNPQEARRKLEAGGLDLAILDIRLVNDSDAKDASGLSIAKEVAPTVPKIILTDFPSYHHVREALRPQLQGLPAAVDFLAKEEGPEALLEAVHRTLRFAPVWLGRTIDGLSGRLVGDYEDARRQSSMNYWASLAVAIIGVVIIFAGIFLAFSDKLAVGIPSAVGGIVTEAVTYLFFKRVDAANKRMDQYHAELLRVKHFENLLAACDNLSSPEQRESCKEKVINAATRCWLGFQGLERAEPETAHASG